MLSFPLIWRVRKWPTDGPRFGERCRILARGAMNSVLVEFQKDGKKYVTLKWFVRSAP